MWQYLDNWYDILAIKRSIFLTVWPNLFAKSYDQASDFHQTSCQSGNKPSYLYRSRLGENWLVNSITLCSIFCLTDHLKLVQGKMLLGRIRVSKSSYAFIIFLFLFVGSSPTQGDFFFMKSDIKWAFFTYSNNLEIHVINLWEICTRNEKNRNRDLFMYYKHFK